jgi:hypothetical protein
MYRPVKGKKLLTLNSAGSGSGLEVDSVDVVKNLGVPMKQRISLEPKRR